MYEWTLHILKTTTKTQKRWEKKIDDLMGKKIGGEVTLNDKNKRRKKKGWRKKDKEKPKQMRSKNQRGKTNSERRILLHMDSFAQKASHFCVPIFSPNLR